MNTLWLELGITLAFGTVSLLATSVWPTPNLQFFYKLYLVEVLTRIIFLSVYLTLPKSVMKCKFSNEYTVSGVG